MCREAGRGPTGGCKVGLAGPVGLSCRKQAGLLAGGVSPGGGLCLPKYDCGVVSREPGEGQLL